MENGSNGTTHFAQRAAEAARARTDSVPEMAEETKQVLTELFGEKRVMGLSLRVPREALLHEHVPHDSLKVHEATTLQAHMERNGLKLDLRGVDVNPAARAYLNPKNLLTINAASAASVV